MHRKMNLIPNTLYNKMDEVANMNRACGQDDLETVIYMRHNTNICTTPMHDGRQIEGSIFASEWAAINGKIRIIVYLNLNFNMAEMSAQILQASIGGHLLVIKWLIENVYTDVNLENINILSCASYNGHLQLVKYLIEERNINIHVCGDIALANATIVGHLSLVKYLVEHGANVYARNSRALRYAVRYKHNEVVNYLVKQRTCGQNIIEWFTSCIRK